MIKGEKRRELTKEEVLKTLTEYDIYKLYFGNFKINEVTYNHLRGEDTRGTPSFIISNRGGELHHYDWANSNWSGDCFKLVQQIHNCSFSEALRIIDKDFGLGILPENNTGKYKQIKKEYKQPEEIGKRYSLIQCVTKKFTKEELDYWAQYYQTIDDLKSNHVYSIKELYIDKKKYVLRDDELRFGYLYNGYWKIYRPYSDKKRKWLSNVPITTMYGLENLSKDKNTLVTKSLKDYLVCKKIYDNVCHVQNESLASFSPENVQYIKNNSKEVFVGFDNDSAGKKASWDVTTAFQWRHINPPDRLLCDNYASDWADWAKCNGLEEVKKHFIKKGLIE